MASLAPVPWTVAPSVGNLSNETDFVPFLPEGLFFHPHWQLYREFLESMPDLSYYILGIYIAFVCTIGILGNLLVIYIFTTTRSLRSPSNMFIINLAISDLGFSLVNGFPLMTISCFTRAWYFGGLACQLYGFGGGLFGYNSIASLACISYDRYFVISKPLEAMRKATKKRALLQILMCWAWSLLWSAPPLFGWGAYIPEGFQTWCSFDYLTRDWANISFVICITVFAFLFPVMMIAYCYVNIINAVVAQKKEMAKTAEKMGAKTTGDDAKSKAQEITLAKIAAGTITLFLLSWLPYTAIAMMGISGMTPWVNPYTATTPVMAAKASAMWNPIIYALSHPRFRAVLDAKFPWLVCCSGRNMDKGGPSKGMTTSNTNASNMSVEMKGRRDEDSSSICTEISESGITDAGGNQGMQGLVETNPDPSKSIEAKVPLPPTPLPTEKPPTEDNGNKYDPKAKLDETRTKRKFGSSRRATGKVLGAKAADALRGAMHAYISLRAASASKVEEAKVQEAEGYVNPVYAPEEADHTIQCTSPDEPTPAECTPPEDAQPDPCTPQADSTPAQCTSAMNRTPAQCTPLLESMPTQCTPEEPKPQCTETALTAPAPDQIHIVDEIKTLSTPPSDQPQVTENKSNESDDSKCDADIKNSIKKSPGMEFNPDTLNNDDLSKPHGDIRDKTDLKATTDPVNGISLMAQTFPDTQNGQVDPPKVEAQEMDTIKIVPVNVKEMSGAENDIATDCEHVMKPDNVKIESVINIDKKENLSFDDGFV